MNIPQIEARLQQEQEWLEACVRANNPVGVAIAQSHIRYWQSELFKARLEDEGGWKP